MLRIDWTRQALADLDRLEGFLFHKNPQAAARAVLAIVDAARQLTDFPDRGRLARDDYRELPVRFSNGGYIILYQVAGNTVRIVRVRHMREDQF
ncbi:MAG: type II toxin-antitoxin system RelE/ParE family toxin [Devosia nanyangense]|uniref:Type II toxin-antitoxin system RelE/ParE family toxin n=1 Tax=Devosia nanyangense TaxID=1228055 RepID=A0A933NY49_9HYPH|nr:type II toxin-antitoxin system RelE/ParE family toxin [Devosia nanyangense]